MPWEWSDDAVPQQVLEKVSFSVKSGQMLAILGTSGKTAWEAPYADPDFFPEKGGGVLFARMGPKTLLLI